MVGIEDFHKYSRGVAGSSPLVPSTHTRLQPVEGPRATQARHRRGQKPVVRTRECGLEDDKTPNLLVSDMSVDVIGVI